MAHVFNLNTCCDGGPFRAILSGMVPDQEHTPRTASALGSTVVSTLVHLVFSIRGALSLVGLVAVAPALAIIVFSGLEHGRMLEQEVRTEVRRQAESFAQIQNQITGSVQQTLSTVASVQVFQEPSRERQEAFMARILERNPEYVNIAYTDTQGFVLASPQLEIGTDLSDRKHIQDAVQRGGFAVGEYVISRYAQEESLAFAQAVEDEQGRTLGALGLVYRLSNYAEVFEQLEFPPESTLSLLDHRGITLFSHPAGMSEVGKPGISASTAEGAASASPHPTGKALAGPDGVRRYYASRQVYLPGAAVEAETPYLTVMLGIPEERARAPMVATLRRNTLLMAGVIVAALVLVQIFGNLVFGRRLHRLNFVAERISQGHISADFDLPSDPSEIGRLGRQMQNMAQALEARSRERDLTEKSLQESVQEKDTLLREVHHRVKNNLQLILSLVRLQRSQELGSSEDQLRYDGFTHGLEGRLTAMSEVHEMLYADVDVSEIQLDQFIPRVSRVIRSIYGKQDPAFTLEPVALPLEQAVPVGLIVNELLTNAYRHGSNPTGSEEVAPGVELTRKGDTVTLVVRDHGPGLPPDFDPHTATGSTGLGCTLVQSLAAQLGGTAAWANAAGDPMTGTISASAAPGTTATLQFTVHARL
ncbi:MAG: HAMP domain-containing protein [Spirochaetaceae bacterium]|nr:MAG: HAMP domain-containing protein [Spirochaetaceae bacterium]